jgi:hypothetical protein
MGVAYLVTGGVLVYSGFHGSTPTATLRGILTGNLSGVAVGLPISTPAASTSGGGGTSGQTITGGAASADAAANQNLAKTKILPGLGLSSWTTGQNWDDLVKLWNQESGWNAKAKNASSGAYGIAQALPESKYPHAGTEAGGSDPGAQISWGAEYIKGRYGNPVMAWAHETSNNWY